MRIHRAFLLLLMYIKPATHALVDGGIAAIILGSMILRLVISKRRRSPKDAQRPEDGHKRAENREERWYALDEPMAIDRTPLENH